MLRGCLLLINLMVVQMSNANIEYYIDGIQYDVTIHIKSDHSTYANAFVVKNSRIPDGYKGDVVVPEKFDIEGGSCEVVGFSNDAFYNCKDLTSLTIPASVTKIGVEDRKNGKNFINCPNLRSIIVEEGNANYISIDGVLYDKSVTTIICYPEARSGAYVVPNSVTVVETNERVVFRDLSSLTMGTSVESVSSDIWDNPNLARINVVPENTTYSSIDGILYNKAQDELIRMPIKYSGEISYPDKLKIIGTNALSGCAIDSLILPETIETIYPGAFKNCTSLKSIMLPQSVSVICKEAFRNCTGLTSLVIPASVKGLGEYLLAGCQLSILVLYCTNNGTSSSQTYYRYVFDGMDATTIFAHESQFYEIRKWHKSANLISLDKPENMEIVPYLRGAKIVLKQSDSFRLKSLYYGDTELFPDENGEYLIKGLPSGKTSTLTAYYDYQGYDIIMYPFITTQDIVVTPHVTPTQTTLQLGIITNTEDETVENYQKYYEINYRKYQEGDTIRNLQPNAAIYPCYAFVEFEDGTRNSISFSISTLGLNPRIEETILTPSTIRCQVLTDEGDAHIDSEKIAFRLNDKDTVIIGNELFLKGIEPQSTFNFTYEVTTQERSKETLFFQLKTSPLEFSTLAPKVSNKGEAIVAATTNLADIETNVGFEWRKVDAPEVVPSKSATAAIYEGTMEGLIKNLDVASYYQVRPYYESVAGNKYYGEWIGFDPSDFSYFEPTVHTYAEVEVSEGTAVLTGYALAGTDEVLEQGFEYWVATGNNSSTRRVPQNVQIVIATGQRMIATLTGLQDNATYYYRAYVKTAKGTTYGEERSFLTPVAAGIESTVLDSPVRTVIGYYNLQGKKFDEPQKGMMIIRYSDGTTRKIVSR